MNREMFAGIGELCLAQEDGELPTTLAFGCAPGEGGLTVLNLRFEGSLHVSGTSRQHLILFQQMTESRTFKCRFADRTASHEPATGSVAICPAGIDQAADAVGSVDVLVVAMILAGSRSQRQRTRHSTHS